MRLDQLRPAPIAEACAKFSCQAALVDGEILVQDENGISDFEPAALPSTRLDIGWCSLLLIF
jgi:hypothetical protein